ncbi:MAG: YeeE/YedE family protein [Beijerinckiaceae bacterium]
MGLLVLVGVFAGFALYMSSFGFAHSWRQVFGRRRSVGVRAQIVMLGLTIAAFFPLLGQGAVLGKSVSGFINPVGLALCLGAFLFGIGMQLGGGCGSGTLYTVGGGNSRTAVTLIAFIFGSVVATANPFDWLHWPSLGEMSLIDAFGVPWALVISLGALVIIYVLLLRFETAEHHSAQPLFNIARMRPLRGPWPLVVGAMALALVNTLTLLLIGRPWGITNAFALWGAKVGIFFGFDIPQWDYWRGDPSLSASVLQDPTSLMDLAIIVGAFGAAGMMGQYRPQRKMPLRLLAASILGGILMGIGARLGTGCNIGAFFSGTASGSLHGVIWLVFALPGNMIGARFRRFFGMGD